MTFGVGRLPSRFGSKWRTTCCCCAEGALSARRGHRALMGKTGEVTGLWATRCRRVSVFRPFREGLPIIVRIRLVGCLALAADRFFRRQLRKVSIQCLDNDLASVALQTRGRPVEPRAQRLGKLDAGLNSPDPRSGFTLVAPNRPRSKAKSSFRGLGWGTNPKIVRIGAASPGAFVAPTSECARGRRRYGP